MSNTKRRLIYAGYFLLLFLVIKINSDLVVHWLNKSIFLDYHIDPDTNFQESFSNGFSLIFAITVFLYSIFGNAIVSILILDISMFGLIFGNQFKVTERNEFVTFTELKTVFSPQELLSFVGVSPMVALPIAAAIMLVLAILQWQMTKMKRRMNFRIGKIVRISLLFISIGGLSIIFANPNDYNEHVLQFEKTHIHNFNPLKRARQDGYLPTLMHTIKPTYMDKPDGYNEKRMDNISAAYNQAAEDINQNRDQSLNESQTLLYLSESLMDPSQMPDLLLNKNPIPFISKMTESQIGGTMYSQFIGGGTANLEWSAITSFSLEVFKEPLVITPYSDFYADSKNHHTILDFYQQDRVAIHPYTAHLYNRKAIYDLIGFDEFRYLNHGIHHTNKLGDQQRVSDEALNKDIMETANQFDTGYIHILSMQNHSPYHEGIPDMKYKPEINPDVFQADNKQELVNYLQSIHASDKATKELIKELDDSEKEVNLLFFGDHFPSVFRGTEEQFGDLLHQTPWFIYMSDGRSEDGIQLDNLSPAFFVPVLLSEGNYKVSPYQGLMDILLESGVKRIGKDYIFTDEGKIRDEKIPQDLLKKIHDYRMIQYDALFGHDWLPDEFYEEK